MDKIIIEDLEVYAFHGVAPEEKELGQMFLVSLQIGLDLHKAAADGDLNATINYAELCNTVKKVLQSEKYDLIETAAEKIVNVIFQNFNNAKTIIITLKKPWAPMGHHLKYAAVQLERARGDNNEC